MARIPRDRERFCDRCHYLKTDDQFSGNGSKICNGCHTARQLYKLTPEYREHQRRQHVVRAFRMEWARRHGSLSEGEWLSVLKQADYRCQRCGISSHLSLDHIVPVSRNGLDTLDNAQVLCRACNSSKNATVKDYRPDPLWWLGWTDKDAWDKAGEDEAANQARKGH